MIHIPNDIKPLIRVEAGSFECIANSPVPAWHEQSLTFLNQLSVALRKRDESRSMPDIMALAFWLRKANLETIKKNAGNDEQLVMGLGLSFHICPSNVPVNFVYSLAFALLAGNSCVLKLSSSVSPAGNILLEELRKLLQSEQYAELQERVLLLRYPHNDDINQFWISRADARIFWGGDATIDHMRRFLPPPRSREVSFADRYSFALLDPENVSNLQADELKGLAQRLYNDIYLMDQAACSSPQLVVWLGSADAVVRAQSLIWPALNAIAAQKYELTGIKSMNKFVDACNAAINFPEVESVVSDTPYLTRIRMSSLSKQQQERRGYAGTVFETCIRDLSELGDIISERYQTLTYFGLSKERLRNFIEEQNLRGIDRIVPVGDALKMESTWDGYDVISSLSRQVCIY